MDFEATVVTVMPLTVGQGARGEWKKQDVIFEQPGEFSRKICVEFWGDKAADAAALQPGDRVALSINIESREYNGRWYTSVRAWRMNRLENTGAPAGGFGDSYGAPAQAPMAPVSSYSADTTGVTSAAEVDDLPF